MTASLAADRVFGTNVPESRGHSWRTIVLVFLIAIAARSAHLTRPLLGNFATKNAAYGMIARNFARGNAPLWRPTVDVIINGNAGAHLLEVPLSAYLAGWGWDTLGGSLDVWGRALTVLQSALAAALLVCLGGRWFGRQAGMAAGVAYALSPVSIIYGQSFMLEASVTFFAVAAMLCLDIWRSKQRGVVWLALCGLTLAALFLTKIYMLMILWPIAWLAYRGKTSAAEETEGGKQQEVHTEGTRKADVSPRRRLLLVGIVAFLAVLPSAAWLAYVYDASAANEENSHIFYSLRNSAAAHAWPPPILRSASFYQRLVDGFAGIVLTPIGLAFLVLGLASKRWLVLIPWFGCSLVLLLALPLKFHEMNYYFVPILPPFCLLIGIGWQNLAQHALFRRPLWQASLVAVVLLFSARYAARPAFMTPAEDQSVVAAADAVREVTSAEDTVATLHGTSIDLLYYCDRRGWAISVHDPDLQANVAKRRADGASLLVIAQPQSLPESTLASLKSDYPVLREVPGYVILRLAGEDE